VAAPVPAAQRRAGRLATVGSPASSRRTKARTGPGGGRGRGGPGRRRMDPEHFGVSLAYAEVRSRRRSGHDRGPASRPRSGPGRPRRPAGRGVADRGLHRGGLFEVCRALRRPRRPIGPAPWPPWRQSSSPSRPDLEDPGRQGSEPAGEEIEVAWRARTDGARDRDGPGARRTRGRCRRSSSTRTGSPVDELDLIVTLGRLCAALAGKIGEAADPPVDAATVLSELALQWGGTG